MVTPLGTDENPRWTGHTLFPFHLSGGNQGSMDVLA